MLSHEDNAAIPILSGHKKYTIRSEGKQTNELLTLFIDTVLFYFLLLS